MCGNNNKFYQLVDYLNDRITGRVRCYLGVIAAIIYNLSFSAIHYGFPSLISAYIDMGVFSSLCSPIGNEMTPPVCSEQLSAFGDASLIWSLAMAISVFPIGYILDRFGIKLVKVIAILFTLTGSLLQAYTKGDTSNFYYFASAFTAVGGMASLTASICLANFFPKYPGIIVGLVSGAFDSSTIIYMVMAKTHSANLIDLKNSFLVLSGMGLLSGTFLALFIYPWRQEDMHKYASKGEYSHGDHDKEGNHGTVEDSFEAMKRQHYPTISSVLTSSAYLTHMSFFILAYIRFSFFFTILAKVVNDNFPMASSSGTRSELLNGLSYFLMSGILLAPFVGLFFDLVNSRKQKSTLHMNVE